MVSSSLTQVAALPSMHEQEKSIGQVHVTPKNRAALISSSNGYGLAEPTSRRKSITADDLAQSNDAYSEPSTSESADVSPRSDNSDLPLPEGTETFVDAPQMIPPLEDQQATKEAPLVAEPPPIVLNDSAQRDQKVNGTARAEISEGTQGRVPGETPQANGASSTQSHKRTTSQSLKAAAQQEPLSSAARSTASKRAAAVAAEELNDDVLVGTRVSEGHENFVTAYNMLTGIRVAVSRCTAKNKRPLTDADFSATDEISFDLSGGGSNPSSKFIFHFKDYAPWVFRHLRDAFRLDPVDYLMSLTSKYIVSELGSPGKSGSFFYYSRDYRFIIKTIRHSEHKLLRRILREYYSHVQNNPNTLISQFYGLHRVRLPFGRKIHFVVMNNVFPALYEIHERYDLKGSLLGREYHPDLTKPVVVYKDLDWLRRHRRIVLGPEKRERLVAQLEKDTRFLERVNVMDYSLLIGIHDMSKGNAALKALLRLEEFGPQNAKVSEFEKRDATVVMSKGGPAGNNTGKKEPGWNRASERSRAAQKDFADLQTLLKKATPEKLKQFDFADEYRSEFYFYHDHGGFQSTNDQNEELDVIYYIGVIDFLTGYTFKKSVETFCKSLIHDRKELSAVPSKEYGDRFLKFMRGCIGPVISSAKPAKRQTGDSQLSTKPGPQDENKAGGLNATVAGQGGLHSSTVSEKLPGSPHTLKVNGGEPLPRSASGNVVADKGRAITSSTVSGSTEAKGPQHTVDNTGRSSVAVYGQDLLREP